MPRQDYASSISIKFELETVAQLRKEALENQRSLSGQVRHLIYKSLQPKDSDKNQSEMTTNQSKTIGGYDGK
jgi:hypothetical protein